MNEELPLPFEELTPRRAPAALRTRVLRVVDQELKLRSRPRWGRMIEIAVAASFVLGVGLNVWQQRAEQDWQLRVFGPRPVQRDISEMAEAIASVTDAKRGKWMQQKLSDARPSRQIADPSQHKRHERLLRDLTDFTADEKL